MNTPIKKRLLDTVPQLLMVLCVLCFSAAIYQVWQWRQANTYNLSLRNHTILKQVLGEADYQQAYATGYLYAKSKMPQQAVKAYLHAEASSDMQLRALSEYALGNQYFDMSMQATNIGAGGAHQQAVAYITLAREAYKGALRIRPDMYAARFNLELLDRLSPDKRIHGWQAETDGVTLQPFKQNGTAMMRDNKRRGLP